MLRSLSSRSSAERLPPQSLCRGSSSLRSAAPPSLGAGAGHSFLPPDRRLGHSATPSRSNLPWSAELPTPSEAKTPSFGGTGGCHADCDCIIVYSAVSSTPMTDGRHALNSTLARATLATRKSDRATISMYMRQTSRSDCSAPMPPYLRHLHCN
jgi:hypothetical protein